MVALWVGRSRDVSFLMDNGLKLQKESNKIKITIGV